jgi:hypothetical protein
MARCKRCELFVFRHLESEFTRSQNKIKTNPARALGGSSSTGWVYKHHASLDSLQRSAEAGCELCGLLWGGLCEPIDVERIPPGLLREKEHTGVRIYCFSAKEGILPELGLLAKCGNDGFVKFGIESKL